MENKKFHVIWFSRAWEDTKSEIKKHKYIELGILGGGSVFIAVKHFLFGSVLKQTIIECSGLFGTLFIAFIVIFFMKWYKASEDIFLENQNKIKSLNDKIELLEEQQKPKLEIGFNVEQFPGCLDDTSNAYESPQTGKAVCVAFSQKWRIFIYNPSATDTIKNVEVKLIDIDKCLLGSARNLPEVHLKFAHDNKCEQRFTDIHPKSRKFVDVIECYMKSTQINENIFYVKHIEKNESYGDLTLFFKNIDKENCRIRIEVEAENTTCIPQDFIIGLIDNVIKMWEVKTQPASDTLNC